MYNRINSFTYRLPRIIETTEPGIKINTTEAYHLNQIFPDTTSFHPFKNLIAIHVMSPAIRMGDNHNIFYTKLVYSNQQTTDHTAERMGNNGTGIFYYLCIAISETQSGRK